MEGRKSERPEKTNESRIWSLIVKISLFFFQQITNASKNLVKIIVEKKSTGFVPKVIQTVEDKYKEYAEENLRNGRNGTLEENNEELG